MWGVGRGVETGELLSEVWEYWLGQATQTVHAWDALKQRTGDALDCIRMADRESGAAVRRYEVDYERIKEGLVALGSCFKALRSPPKTPPRALLRSFWAIVLTANRGVSRSSLLSCDNTCR